MVRSTVQYTQGQDRYMDCTPHTVLFFGIESVPSPAGTAPSARGQLVVLAEWCSGTGYKDVIVLCEINACVWQHRFEK